MIILGIFDLGKAVIVSDEKEVKAAQSRLIKRFIYAAATFFIVTLVTVLMNIVSTSDSGESDPTSWKSCWTKV